MVGSRRFLAKKFSQFTILMKSCSCQRVTIQTNYESMSMQLANGAWMVDHLKYINIYILNVSRNIFQSRIISSVSVIQSIIKIINMFKHVKKQYFYSYILMKIFKFVKIYSFLFFIFFLIL